MAKKTLLKKVGGKKEMKKMYGWCVSHISTPEAWFWKWEKLLKDISSELGFTMESLGAVEKVKRKHWTQLFKLKHQTTSVEVHLLLRRKRRQEGGEISLLKYVGGGDSFNLLTTIITWNGLIECKMTIGNQYISFLRDNWATLAETSS